MKHIKLRITLTVLLTTLVLFASFLAVFNLLLPPYMTAKAKEALRYEQSYFKTGAANADDGQSAYAGNFLSPGITYLYFDGGDSFTYATWEERQLISYCQSERYRTDAEGFSVFRAGQCRYVFQLVRRQADADMPTGSYILYIDIGATMRYAAVLNRIFFCVLAVAAIAASAIGMHLGRSVEQAEIMQRTFFQNASHELKTPLMSIQGYAEGIQTGVVSPKAAAGIILEESDRMTSLVEELLELSKIESKQYVPKMRATDLREILYDCFRSMEPILKRRSLQIVPTFAEAAVLVYCDENMMRQALINLLSNAVRHAGTMICVDCMQDKRIATVRIRDDGAGICMQDMEHLFDRFYTGKSGKSGIGLALTKEIVLLHNGKIRAYNGVSGAVFELQLPKK